MSSTSFVSAAALSLEAAPSFGASFIVSHFRSHEVQGGSACVCGMEGGVGEKVFGWGVF